MLQDVQAGRKTEIEYLNGYVLGLATAPTPVNRMLYNLIKAHETVGR